MNESTMNQPNLYFLAVCNQVESLLGFKIKNIAEAQKASDHLANQKLHISPHTIARLFGVVKPFRTPYKDTLNILARFLEYDDWEDFCTNQTNTPFDPNYFLTESSDGFSLAVLQLALANEDLLALQQVLEKAKENENEAIVFTAAELIGAFVRKSNKQKELLQVLANSTSGHTYFYECYVDEDNAENYFSEALINYYLPQIDNEYKKLYVYCFNISQIAHKEQKVSAYFEDFIELTSRLDITKCHFHEFARWRECLILKDGFDNKLMQTWESHVEEINKASNQFSANEFSWILFRALKALLLFGYKEEIFKNKGLNERVDQLINNQKKEGHSMALYGIQLYWICKSIHFKNKTTYAPFRIHNILFQNESHEKAAIEFAIAALFATGDNKKIITSNLKSYCDSKGIHWIYKLVSN